MGLDPTSGYHLAQIVGMVLLYAAVSGAQRYDVEALAARSGYALA